MSEAVHRYWQSITQQRIDGYQEIARRYAAGATFDELRAALHCGSETIKKACATYGVPVRSICHRDREKAPAPVIDPTIAEAELASVTALLADVLPAGAKVTTKSFSHLCQEIRDAKCPYCRVMIAFPCCGRKVQGETVEGSHFGANTCAEGDCDVLPGPEREAAFRAYVDYRKRQWQAISGLDTKIAHARANAERAGEAVLTTAKVGGA